MKKFFILLLIVSAPLLGNEFARANLVTPLFLKASETDTIFRNPAELTLHRYFAEGRLSFGSSGRIGSIIMIHFPDQGPFYKVSPYGELSVGNWNLGDLSFSYEAFVNNFGDSVFLIDDSEGSRVVSSDSGKRAMVTWAKQTRFLSVGTNIKFYQYQNTGNNTERNVVSTDLGMFFTPFTDLYLGAAINDIGSPKIRDDDGNVVLDENGNESVIEQDIRFSLAVISKNKDMSFSVGIPASLIDDIDNYERDAWKVVSFQGYKIFDDWLEISLGSNTQDLYASIGIYMNKNIKVSAAGTRDILNKEDYGFTATVGAGITIEDYFNYFKPKEKKKEDEKSISVKRKSRRELNQEKKEQKKSKDVYDEIEEELNQQIKELEEKKEKLQTLKKKEEIYKQLEEE